MMQSGSREKGVCTTLQQQIASFTEDDIERINICHQRLDLEVIGSATDLDWVMTYFDIYPMMKIVAHQFQDLIDFVRVSHEIQTRELHQQIANIVGQREREIGKQKFLQADHIPLISIISKNSKAFSMTMVVFEDDNRVRSLFKIDRKLEYLYGGHTIHHEGKMFVVFLHLRGRVGSGSIGPIQPFLQKKQGINMYEDLHILRPRGYVMMNIDMDAVPENNYQSDFVVLVSSRLSENELGQFKDVKKTLFYAENWKDLVLNDDKTVIRRFDEFDWRNIMEEIEIEIDLLYLFSKIFLNRSKFML